MRKKEHKSGWINDIFKDKKDKKTFISLFDYISFPHVVENKEKNKDEKNNKEKKSNEHRIHHKVY